MVEPETRVALRLAEYDAEVADSRRSLRRHTLFALLGLSPAAFLPVVGLGIDFGPEAVGAAVVFITGWEAWQAVRARIRLKDAQEARTRLLEAAGGEPGE